MKGSHFALSPPWQGWRGDEDHDGREAAERNAHPAGPDRRSLGLWGERLLLIGNKNLLENLIKQPTLCTIHCTDDFREFVPPACHWPLQSWGIAVIYYLCPKSTVVEIIPVWCHKINTNVTTRLDAMTPARSIIMTKYNKTYLEPFFYYITPLLFSINCICSRCHKPPSCIQIYTRDLNLWLLLFLGASQGPRQPRH